MTSLQYYKLSGCGNDFLALVEPEHDPAQREIAAWCRRGVSLGADGFFILRRGDGAVVMDYFNADGRPADLCLNGTRCAARLAFELGWAERELVVATGAGPIRARPSGRGHGEIEIEIPTPPSPHEIEAAAAGETWRGWFVPVGVPHFVIVWSESLARAPLEHAGPELRRHNAFGAAGTNVNFVRFPTAGRLEIRTYERGVEAETLACGTGVLAAAAAGLASGRSALPLVALTRGGFELQLRAVDDRRWALTGDARILAAGALRAEAAVGPDAARFSA